MGCGGPKNPGQMCYTFCILIREGRFPKKQRGYVVRKKGTIGFLAAVLLFFFSGCERNLAPALAFSAGLGRGINLSNALEAPNEGEWGIIIQDEFFQIIADAGFDTVRLPIRWSAHVSEAFPYTIDAAFFARVDHVVNTALAQGLKVVIDFHHFEELLFDPSEQNIVVFERIWVQLAQHYRNFPLSVYFELLNEPGYAMNWATWNTIVARVVPQIRAIDPVHTLVIGEINGTGEFMLPFLSIPPEASPVIATFHYYEPIFVTHQGAPWMDPIFQTLGVSWPGPPPLPVIPVPAAQQDPWASSWFADYNTLPTSQNPAGPTPILEFLDQAARWSRQNNVPLWLGEFGTIRLAPDQTRLQWTRFVREEAEKRGIDHAYWGFAAEFGVYNLDEASWNEELLQCLLD